MYIKKYNEIFQSTFLRTLTAVSVSTIVYSASCSTAAAYPTSTATLTVSGTTTGGTDITFAVKDSAGGTTGATVTYTSGINTASIVCATAITTKGVYHIDSSTLTGGSDTVTMSDAAKALTFAWVSSNSIDTTNTKDQSIDLSSTTKTFTLTFANAIESFAIPVVKVNNKEATCTASAKVATCTITKENVPASTTPYTVKVTLPCATTETDSIKLTVSSGSSSSSSFINASKIALLFLVSLLF